MDRIDFGLEEIQELGATVGVMWSMVGVNGAE